MKFTWWTYRVAMRRQFKREYAAFCDHHGALRGPHEWYREMLFGRRLSARFDRERRSR